MNLHRRYTTTAAIATLTLTACLSPSTTATPSTALLQFAAGDSVTIDTVSPGIVRYRVRRATGPFSVQIVTVPVGSRYEFVASRAHDSLRSRERVTEMVRRHRDRGERIPVALNADFFDLKTGANENNQIINGEIWKAVPVTDSPFDTFRNSHIQFAATADGRPLIDRFSYAGTLTSSCGQFILDGINGIPRLPNALILFTGASGDAPRRDSTHVPRETAARVVGAARPKGIGSIDVMVGGDAIAADGAIAADRAVFAAYGTAAARLDSVSRCTSALRVNHAFRPDRGRLTTIVGGWPRVVQDGRNVGGAADSVEGTFPRFSAQRHPRSAVGFTRDSSMVLLVAVDGRQETSDGMSLTELGEFLVSIGAYQAMNFDGGGSTGLVLNGVLANKPSDATGERAVGNAVLVRER